MQKTEKTYQVKTNKEDVLPPLGKVNMFKYVIITKSDSGDDYIYFLQSEKVITESKAEKWLKKEGKDPGYEYIRDFEKIEDSNFRIMI